MEKKTVKLPFLIFAFLTLFSQRIYSSSKNISFLSLDFVRTDSTSIKGSITYSKSPYYFIFKTTFPQAQTMYCNADGAYILEENTVTNFPDGTEVLEQLCSDFLNWFKSDFGLAESFFAPTLVWQENTSTVSQWDYQNHDEHPLDKVIVYSDSLGRFTQINMYMTSDSETPVTSTFLDNFEYDAGFYYPTKITSIAYENETSLMTTELVFSNIKFSGDQDARYAIQKNELQTLQQQDLSLDEQINSPAIPAPAVYNVSIPSVLVNASYKFYKKYITNQDMTNCPFYPSCSQYMMDAIAEHGAAGFFMGLDRLNRCTSTEHKRNMYPTLSNGKHYDPVPAKQKKGSSK